MAQGFSAPVYIPDGLTLEDMKVVLYDALKGFYLTPENILRGITQARSASDVKQVMDLLCGFIPNTSSI